MALIRSGEALSRLLEILGLQHQHHRRAVISFSIDGPVMIYLQRYIHEEEMDGITDLIASQMPQSPAEIHEITGGASVDDQGRVFIPEMEYHRMLAELRLARVHLQNDDTREAEEVIAALLEQGKGRT